MKQVEGLRLRVASVMLIAVLSVGGAGAAQEKKQPPSQTGEASEEATLFPVPDYSGDFLSRSYLTGDWGGLRNKLADHGVQFDVDLLQVFQDVTTGGLNDTGRYGGFYSMALKLDFHKAGLWPGAFLYARAQAAFANSVNSYSGGLMPVNTAPVLLLPTNNELVLPTLYFTQFLSESFGIQLGKLDLTQGDANEFAHGIGDKKFMNLAFSFNPVVMRIAPTAALGMNLIYLPTKDIELVFSAFDTEGRVNTSGFSTLFENSTTIASAARFKIQPFGLTGHQSVAFMWANGNFTALNQDPRTIIGSILLGTPPDELHRKLKARAAMKGLSLSDYLLQEVERLAERPTLNDLRRRLVHRESVTPRIPPAKAVRAERERH